MLTRFLVGFTLLLVAGYGLVKAWPLLSGPVITIDSPANYESAEGGTITVSGHEKWASTLTLNDGPLLSDENGAFSKTLAFAKGNSILTFVATDRFGRIRVEQRLIFVP